VVSSLILTTAWLVPVVPSVTFSLSVELLGVFLRLAYSACMFSVNTTAVLGFFTDSEVYVVVDTDTFFSTFSTF